MRSSPPFNILTFFFCRGGGTKCFTANNNNKLLLSEMDSIAFNLKIFKFKNGSF